MLLLFRDPFAIRASVFSTTAAASYATTSSYTPAANSLLVACVVGSGDTSDPNHATTPFSGHGVSWTKIGLSANSLSTTHAVSVWVANAGATPSSAACTAQWQTNRTGCAIVEYEIGGANLSAGPVAAIVQSSTNTGTGTSGTFSLSSAFEHVANRVLAFFLHLANEGKTPRPNWTEAPTADGNYDVPATGLQGQYRGDAFEQTASASWASNVAWRGVGLEVRMAASFVLTLGLGALSLAGHAIGSGFGGPPTGQLAITGAAPTVTAVAGVTTQLPAGALSIAGLAPVAGQTGGPVPVPAGQLAISGRSVGVGFGPPPTGSVAITGRAPGVSVVAGGGLTLDLPIGAIAFTTRVVGVSAGAIPTGTLTLEGQYVKVSFLGPDIGALTLTGQAPAAVSGIKPVPVGSLALTGRGTTTGTKVAMGAGSLAISGQIPAVLAGQFVLGLPAGSMSVSMTTPTMLVSGSPTAAPATGSMSFSGNALTIGERAGVIRIVIGGNVLDGVSHPVRLELNSLSYTDDLNSRNTLSCMLYDPNGTFRPQCGTEVILYDGDGVTKLFAGTIDEPEEIAIMVSGGAATGCFIGITAVDYNQIADRRLVAKTYTDTQVSLIVLDLAISYLNQEGVVLAVAENGPVLARKVFNYRTLADCLNELSEDTGYSWWIDYNKTLHFRSRAAISAPFQVTPTNRKVRSFKVKSSRAAFRNRQYVRAGRDLTDPLTESFRGDGTRQTFTVGLPIGEEPIITLNGSPQTVGIKQVEDEAAFDWYWNKDSGDITQRSASVPLSSSDLLTVVFRGLFPILVQAQDDNLIADRRSIEGGTGLYESIDDYNEIDDADLAFSTALAKLQRDGLIRQTITIETDAPGLRTGQLCSVSWPTLGIAGDYLIRSVRARDVQGKFLRYAVTMISGDAVGGWIQFYQKLMAKRREAVARDNEQLLLLRAVAQQVSCTDAIDIEPHSKETRIGLAQIGLSEIGII